MREIAKELLDWCTDGEPFAVATVAGARGSAPRSLGAVMAVNAAGDVIGSVSGGCVEGAVYDVALEVLLSGEAKYLSYGVSDDDAFAIGLTCGGTIEVLVQRVVPALDDQLAALLTAINTGKPAARIVVISGAAELGASMIVSLDSHQGTLGTAELDAAVIDDSRGMLSRGTTGHRKYGVRGERLDDQVSVLFQSFTPPPRLLVFGITEYSVALVEIGALLGYRTTVCDARSAFLNRQRFPRAHEVVRDWPHRYLQRTTVDERTVICVLTHDPKFEIPLLTVALRSPAAYVGAMGSRRSHQQRIQRLREAGLTEPELRRLHSPIGLDLGSRTTEETAVAIAAEILLEQTGATGLPLRSLTGPIHA